MEVHRYYAFQRGLHPCPVTLAANQSSVSARTVCAACADQSLRCTHCGGEIRSIAFITAAATGRDINVHLGGPTAPPRIAPARGPPRWAAAAVEYDPSADPVLPPTPAFEFDQRVTW